MKTIRFLPRVLLQVIPVLLTLATGCVGVFPLSEFSNHPTYGTKLRAQDIAFIGVGKTSATEVFALFALEKCLAAGYRRSISCGFSVRSTPRSHLRRQNRQA
jgi:hypothetical protein